MQVVVDHDQRGVAEDALEGQHVAASPQVGDPKRVAEPVWVEAGDTRAPPGLRDDACQRFTRQGAAAG